MARVYAIHTGSYSDQSWGPVFSTVEKAIAYKGSDIDMEVEVHVLDDENDGGLNYPCYRLIFDGMGNVRHSETRGYSELYEPLLHKPVTWEVPTRKGAPGSGVKRDFPDAALVVDNVYAPDLEHAVKIAADVRFQFLAQQH